MVNTMFDLTKMGKDVRLNTNMTQCQIVSTGTQPRVTSRIIPVKDPKEVAKNILLSNERFTTKKPIVFPTEINSGCMVMQHIFPDGNFARSALLFFGKDKRYTITADVSSYIGHFVALSTKPLEIAQIFLVGSAPKDDKVVEFFLNERKFSSKLFPL